MDYTNFKSLADKTAILESLGWDEEAFDQLVSFIELQKECFVPTHPTVLLEQISEFFGEETSKVLKEIFMREYKAIQDSKNEN